ncbi:type 1 glutamine amidotransferase [Fibrella aquatilis]|uniref:GMP synthase n=1 Tax=Fibrella aquatilis TaxID=2817059 RepID=A0A939K0Q9_9BACT|nr:GMP synthase [Fibrella aquatilis]MBO0931480.1 GMP synthase [Fibrella aquatilis]
MRIAILDMYNNVANEGMRCIQQAIRLVETTDGEPLPFTVYNVRAENAVPDLSYDTYISTGGPGVPLPLGEPWEQPYFDFIDALLAYNAQNEVKKPLFLICHSFQLVAGHLGLGKVSKRRSTSFGIFPMHKTADGAHDPLLSALPEPFYAVDSRDYQLTQPDEARFAELGAKLLCLEKIRPHVPLDRAIMAIRFTPEVFGTQFHPEADDEGMLRYFLLDEKRQQITLVYGEDKYNEMVGSLQDPDKIALTEAVIIPGFLRAAIRNKPARSKETLQVY